MCKPKQISATPLLVRRWAASLPARRSSQGARGHSGCPVGCQPCPPALQQPPPLRPALPLSPALWSRVMLRAQPRKKKICRRQGETEGGAGADERRSHLYKKNISSLPGPGAWVAWPERGGQPPFGDERTRAERTRAMRRAMRKRRAAVRWRLQPRRIRGMMAQYFPHGYL
jgi:hypothetical protein